MSSRAKFVLAALFFLIAVVLAMNVRYIFVAPIPNTWVWWPGDETWLMAQYKEFLTTGHYINPYAPGSVYSVCSGVIFGSCYLTALLYALPTLAIHGHTIEVGRVVTWVFSLIVLGMIWELGKRYGLSLLLRAFACFLLASTTCFFMTSHSARSDLLIGFTVLLICGTLPFLNTSKRNQAILLGALGPACLLINGHVLLIAAPAIAYIAWTNGILKNKNTAFVCIMYGLTGLGILLCIQWIVLGSLSITGPFSDDTSMMPYARLLHPRGQWTNYYWRIFIAQMWVPGLMWITLLLFFTSLWARFRYRILWKELNNTSRKFIVCSLLAVLSSVYLEYYWPRYLIFILPTAVLSIMVLSAYLSERLPILDRRIFAVCFSVATAIGLWHYTADVSRFGSVGTAITTANEESVHAALASIHANYSGGPHWPRVFAAVPAQAVAMDDSCELLTPVLYDWPIDKKLSRTELWKRAHIDYAMIYHPAHGRQDWRQTDSSIDRSDLAHARLIYEHIGAISDIDRPYEENDLKLPDTLRVYAFTR